jgi:glycogen debranching enzyme
MLPSHWYVCGQEWVWLFGYYLRAKLKFSNLSKESEQQRMELANEIWKLLTPHRRMIVDSPWCSLPGTCHVMIVSLNACNENTNTRTWFHFVILELTNENGAFCRDACPSQAWSVASIIDAIDELEHWVNDTTVVQLPTSTSNENERTNEDNNSLTNETKA